MNRTILSLLLVALSSLVSPGFAQSHSSASGCVLSGNLAFQLAEDRDVGVSKRQAESALASIPYKPAAGPHAEPIEPANSVLEKVYSFSYRGLSPNALAALVFVQCVPSPDAQNPDVPKLVVACQQRHIGFGEIVWCVNAALWGLPANVRPMEQIVRMKATRLVATQAW